MIHTVTNGRKTADQTAWHGFGPYRIDLGLRKGRYRIEVGAAGTTRSVPFEVSPPTVQPLVVVVPNQP